MLLRILSRCLSRCRGSAYGRAGPTFSMNSMMAPATSALVACSIPLMPGDELTSITTGPRFERSMSTPATLSPSTAAAWIAVLRSSSLMLASSAAPPRCRFERNSPGLPMRRMAATTCPPTTNARTSLPSASLMYSCTRMLTFAALKASMIDFADASVSARITPMPCVPSTSLMTTGAPPTSLMTSSALRGPCAKAVTGRPMPARARSCSARSLSRERPMATLSFSGNTPCISNCRSTARP